MRSEIEHDRQFPGCVGFVDGTDVGLMHVPSFHAETYINWKKVYALNIQAVCDNNLRFTFVSTGYPALVGDSVSFGSTLLFTTPGACFSKSDEYLLGDMIYRT